MTQTPTRILPRPHGRLPQTTHLHKVKIKTHSDRIHCPHKLNSSVQVTRPAQGWLILYVLLQVPLSTAYYGSTSVQPTKNKPCRILHNLKTKSRSNKTIRPRSSWPVIIYTKTKTGTPSHLNPNRLKPTPHSLVTSHSQIITPVT